jgi:hypothetical protein
MNIPERHDATVRLLVSEHLSRMREQAHLLGAGHPAAARAREHLEDARDLARAVGIPVERAA